MRPETSTTAPRHVIGTSTNVLGVVVVVVVVVPMVV